MSSVPRVVGVVLLIVSLAAAVSQEARGAATAAPGTDGRVLGRFAMVARVTTAVGVPGEHKGETLHRLWFLAPGKCAGSVCGRLTLDRQRSSDVFERVELHRTGRGRYAGTGFFYVSLECLGRVYRLGSRAKFRITLTVTSTQSVQGIRFARRIKATYTNRRRTDDTPCPLGPSHDAARYTGELTSPLPSPPTASFTSSGTGLDTVAFTSTSTSGVGGAPITTWQWSFGDPASGAADTSTAADPVHNFSAPGSYSVSLTVTDANGLQGSVTETVTVPAVPSPAPAPGARPGPPASAARAVSRHTGSRAARAR